MLEEEEIKEIRQRRAQYQEMKQAELTTNRLIEINSMNSWWDKPEELVLIRWIPKEPSKNSLKKTLNTQEFSMISETYWIT